MRDKKPIKWALIAKERFVEAEVPTSSVIIAYYLLLSLFPLTIAMGNLLPYLNIAPESVLVYVDLIVPPAAQSVLDPIVISLLTSSSGGLLSLGAIGLVWSASRGIAHLQRGMNKAYGVRAKGGFIIKRGISVLVVFLLLVALGVFVMVFSFGQMLVTALSEFLPWLEEVNQYLRNLRWPVIVLILIIALTMVYRIVPDVKLRLRNIWPGVLFSTAGLLLLTQLFTIYLQFSSRTFSSYGALGAFLALMFWLNFSSMILLIGAVLNASIMEYYHGKAQPQPNRADDFLFEITTGWWRRHRARRAEKRQAKHPAATILSPANPHPQDAEEDEAPPE